MPRVRVRPDRERPPNWSLVTGDDGRAAGVTVVAAAWVAELDPWLGCLAMWHFAHQCTPIARPKVTSKNSDIAMSTDRRPLSLLQQGAHANLQQIGFVFLRQFSVRTCQGIRFPGKPPSQPGAKPGIIDV